jgi:hypothetical protein
MSELLPCPFCSARLMKSENLSNRLAECFIHPEPEDRAPCLLNDIVLWLYHDDRDDGRIAAWNTRATTPTAVDIANAPDFKPCVIHYEDGDFSQMLLEDCATVTGYPGVVVEPLYRMVDRSLVGFQWHGKAPSPVATPTAKSELVEEYYSDDPTTLKQLLARRDKFIVDQGLWSSFVAALSSIGED